VTPSLEVLSILTSFAYLGEIDIRILSRLPVVAIIVFTLNATLIFADDGFRKVLPQKCRRDAWLASLLCISILGSSISVKFDQPCIKH
jgi:hypothetical protein